MSNILTKLRIASTDFLALRLICFNIRQNGRHILYFKLHMHGHKFHYRRPHAAARCAPLAYSFYAETLAKY